MCFASQRVASETAAYLLAEWFGLERTYFLSWMRLAQQTQESAKRDSRLAWAQDPQFWTEVHQLGQARTYLPAASNHELNRMALV